MRFQQLILYAYVLSLSFTSGEERNEGEDLYIVYMGGPTSATPNHPVDLMISSLRNESSVVHSYKRSFSGFAAHLSEEEADEMRGQPGVVSVFPDPILKLHTTHSWDFLDSLGSFQSTEYVHQYSSPHVDHPGSDTIVGVFDTGIWPESKSFDDKHMGPVPMKWKGVCMEGQHFNSSHCNRKLIGARYYTPFKTARDGDGHGTHVASTSVGTPVPNVSFYGFASGTTRGGFPAARLAVYRVCNSLGCLGSAILAAFDDAIADGVDVLSLSLGVEFEGAFMFSIDPVAIGSFHAVQRGITVVCSAGNAGPYPMTVENVAPWILTVAATNIDRAFMSYVVLGNHKVLRGSSSGSHFSKMKTSPIYPLDVIDVEMVEDVKRRGGKGVVLVSDVLHSKDFSITSFETFPLTILSSKDGSRVLTYINSTRNPVGTLLPSRTILGFKPAPTITDFSSRGPSGTLRNIIKPDIAAPGEKILAAWKGNDTNPSYRPSGMSPPQFVLTSGTSMACPHVSGVAAAIKSRNPNWSPAAIRSAVMTSALKFNNMRTPITTLTGNTATAYDMGSGELNTYGALTPGLVYDIEPVDYLNFLCFFGYNTSMIKQLQPSLPASFSCPRKSNPDMISDINYPSIAVHKDVAVAPVRIRRTLTNVDDSEADTVYMVSVIAPSGLLVEVEPKAMVFTHAQPKRTFQVRFSSNSTMKDAFGFITWKNGKHEVCSPFVVSV